MRSLTPTLAAICSAAFISAVVTPALAQPDTVHKQTLQEQQFPLPTYHTLTVKAVVDVGGAVLPHTHPGAEMAYILQGQALVEIAGQPPQKLTMGDSFTIPPEIVHSVRNTGSGPLIIISTYVVDKTKPVSTPVK